MPPPSTDSRRAVIVGAGIGGLTAAISLGRAGWRTRVLEREPRLHPAGAGISLWPNAVNALDSLGLGTALRGVSGSTVTLRESGLFTRRGQPLSAVPVEELERRFGAPLLVVHRAELQALLLDQLHALDPEAVRLGMECMEADPDSGAVTLTTGELEIGDVVVAADGIGSRLRELVDPSPPRYSGFTSWRGVAEPGPEVMAALRFGEYWGSGSLFGAAPLAGGRVYWWSSSRMPETPAGDGPVEKAGLLRLHAGWARPIEELISATPDGAVLRDPLRERPPIPRLTLGRICFVGDAAHPMLPYLGQGGCQAIEDAVELAAAMLVSTDLESALARYQERRERRVAGVVRQSRQMARLAHIRPRAAVAARDLLLRATPRRATLRRLEPLVGHRADGGRTLNPEPLLSRGEATR